MTDHSGNGRFSIGLGQDVPVGTLWLNRARGRVTSTFVYAQSWLQSPEHFELGPDLPLDDAPQSTDGLFFCFRDCTPDRWGRGIVARMERACAAAEHHAPATMLESDFLLRTNDVTRQGALRISKNKVADRLSDFGQGTVPPLTRIPELCKAVQRYCEKRESLADLSLLAACASSSGGARPKANVLGSENELLLAKFSAPDDDRDMPLWEYVTLRLARRAGLRTPDFWLKRVDGQNVLLVRRFDRSGEGNGPHRVPFMSAMTLLGLRDGDQASYVDMAAAIEVHGASPGEDLTELWARMVFNMCVYNVDDHLKNHAFLREQNGWRLSPVFDLETSHPGEKAACLHTAIIDRSGEFSLENALDVAEFFRLGPQDARERLASIRKAVSFWKQEATLAKAKPEKIRVMQEAFEYL